MTMMNAYFKMKPRNRGIMYNDEWRSYVHKKEDFAMTPTDKTINIDEFSFAREQFEMLVTELGSQKTQSLQHGDVEALIDREGRETLRRLFQAHLNLRAAREEKKKFKEKMK